MTVRIWHGSAVAENAAKYRKHVTETVVPSLPRIDGHRGAMLLERKVGTRADSVKGFAGEDCETAVVEPEAQDVLDEYDPIVRHFEVTFEGQAAKSVGLWR
jgi:hypothetical protein